MNVQERERQGKLLQEAEDELKELAAEQKKKAFFDKILPFLGPLRSYIKRRLRFAYLVGALKRGLLSSNDLLGEVVFEAYEEYDKKPKEVPLEIWLYRIANERLREYLRERGMEEEKIESFETMREKELSGFEEKITADVEGEPWLLEELDDSDYHESEFLPPHFDATMPEKTDRKNEVRRIIRALSSVPFKKRLVFELFLMEGFSKEDVGYILDMPADDVPKTAEQVRSRVFQALSDTSRL
jgi:RNA polymerase sigma factor (sigma-70 family)